MTRAISGRASDMLRSGTAKAAAITSEAAAAIAIRRAGGLRSPTPPASTTPHTRPVTRPASSAPLWPLSAKA